MKILLLSDLHGRSDWFRFAESFPADLTAIAGDLLDGFSDEGLLPQSVRLARWAKRFPAPLALCSGNHDANTPSRALDPASLHNLEAKSRDEAISLATSEYWMDLLDGPLTVTDRRSRLLEAVAGRIVITTLPFNEGEAGHPRTVAALWREGAKLRRQSSAPWLVLHHEPPADFSGDHTGSFGSADFAERLREFQPDFALSGHLHLVPYHTSFATRLGKTWCFNPGHPPPGSARLASKPNHILVDTVRSTATWTATQPQGSLPLTRTISLRRSTGR
jgi:Icc-related predicted phosphoesterase